jgi:hypothetical protein
MRGGPGPSSLPPHSPDIAQSCRQLVGSSLKPSHVHDCSSRDDCLLTCSLASAFLTTIAPDLSPTLLTTFDLSLRLCYPSFSSALRHTNTRPPARLPRRAACSSPIEPPTFIYLYPSRLLTIAQQPLGSPHPHSTRAITCACACACASLSPASNERQRRTAAAL